MICLSLVLFRICRGGVRARQDIRDCGADGVSRTAEEIIHARCGADGRRDPGRLLLADGAVRHKAVEYASTPQHHRECRNGGYTGIPVENTRTALRRTRASTVGVKGVSGTSSVSSASSSV